jgi:hypothetical protein
MPHAKLGRANRLGEPLIRVVHVIRMLNSSRHRLFPDPAGRFTPRPEV